MENEIAERKKKRKVNRRRRRLLNFLGFILMLIYIPAIWNWLFSVNHEIGVIKTDTIEIKAPVKGIFIRKELTIKSPGDGIVIPAIQYGERVAKGKDIADFIQNDVKDIVENYRQMEIEILKRVVAEFDSSAGSERDLWESTIEDQLEKLTALSNTGDLTSAESIRNALDNVLESKARYMLDSKNLSRQMSSQKEELERLRNKIKNSVTGISSPISGIVSYHSDGYEEIYTPDRRNALTVDEINRIFNEELISSRWLTPTEIGVKENDIFCKITENDEAWISFIVPEKEGEEIAIKFEKAKLENQAISFELEVNGIDNRIPATIESIGEKNNGFIVITARITSMIERTLSLRAMEGNIVIQSVTGMKIPLRSLFNENQVDNTADIAIVEMNKAKFQRIKILGRQDSYAIIENLDPKNQEKCVNIFDIYLVNPKNIEEGQAIEK
jgi:hypothetical protein